MTTRMHEEEKAMSQDVFRARRHRRPRMTRKTRGGPVLLLRPWCLPALASWLAQHGIRVYSARWTVRIMLGRWLVLLDLVCNNTSNKPQA